MYGVMSNLSLMTTILCCVGLEELAVKFQCCFKWVRDQTLVVLTLEAWLNPAPARGGRVARNAALSAAESIMERFRSIQAVNLDRDRPPDR